MVNGAIRKDHRIILDWIKNGPSVLDLGCNEGELLSLIAKKKNARAHGIEINEKAIYKCVALGLSVSHQDIDNGLSEYGDESFDYVILNQSLQQVKKPDVVLKESLRVGKEVVIGLSSSIVIEGEPCPVVPLISFTLIFSSKIQPSRKLPFERYISPDL